MTKQPDEKSIVFSGIGMLTTAGHGFEENCKTLKNGRSASTREDYRLTSFKPAPHLSDKRMLKAVSAIDAYGLVAVEDAKKNSKFDPTIANPQKTGMYVGANPASVGDNENYFDALRAACNEQGEVSYKEFGATHAAARPTTLLIGLPNNVLCYGSILLNAQGPNSNYTNLETSSHIAVRKAATCLEKNKLEFAMVGGFSSHTDPIETVCYTKFGHINGQNNVALNPYSSQASGTVMADGSVFLSMESRARAQERGSKILATYVACEQTSSATGPGITATDSEALTKCIEKTLAKAQVTPDQIGLVFGSGYSLQSVDQIELEALNNIFQEDKPALATTSTVWGNLMEAGGVGEVGLAHWIYNEELGQIPAHLKVSVNDFSEDLDIDKKYVLILRSSPQGEYSSLLVRVEA